MKRIISFNVFQYLLITILLFGVVECIFIPSYFAYYWARQFAVQLIFVYLGLGVLFLILKLQRLMIVSFVCSAAICLYLKFASNPLLIPDTKVVGMPTFSVSLLNLSISEPDISEAINTLKYLNPDVIALEEITPMWGDTLISVFSEAYPYKTLITNYNSLGVGFLSKCPIVKIDTLLFDNVPNLSIVVESKKLGKKINLVEGRTEPPYSNNTYKRLGNHLDFLAQKITSLENNTIALGSFNVVTWSDEVVSFLTKTNMVDSRRGFMSTYPRAPFSLMTLPTDHVFLTKDLKCVQFNNINSKAENHLGLFAVFQDNVKENE